MPSDPDPWAFPESCENSPMPASPPIPSERENAANAMRASNATEADEDCSVLLGGTPDAANASRVASSETDGDGGGSAYATAPEGLSGGGDGASPTAAAAVATLRASLPANAASLPAGASLSPHPLPKSDSLRSNDSPSAAQGTDGFVSSNVSQIDRRGSSRLSIQDGFKNATAGALERMRAAKKAPPTPIDVGAARRSGATFTSGGDSSSSSSSSDDDDDDDDASNATADDVAPTANGTPRMSLDVIERGGVTPEQYAEEEELRERLEEELAMVQRMSPLTDMSPLSVATDGARAMSPPEFDASPAIVVRKSNASSGFGGGGDDDDKENGSPEYDAGAVEAAAFNASPSPPSASPRDVRVGLRESSRSPNVENGDDASGAGGRAPEAAAAGGAAYAVAVTAKQTPKYHGALFNSVGSPGTVPYERKTPGTNKNVSFGGKGGADAREGTAQKAMMSPLPISKSVLERIDALGPEMQPMQRYMLFAGIVLDFYAKTQLIRELNRFAAGKSWVWFSMVFIFFLLSGSCTCAYWLLHYPMPSKAEIEASKQKGVPKVFGFTKVDFKFIVRNAGAVFSMLQLGTAFAAWRALRTNDLRQRKAEMDLRGMQLVDTVFLLLPVATLQAYVGMACSGPRLECPGRDGFDAWLFFAVVGAITSATLCFVTLDLHEKPPNMTWKTYWAAHKAHLSEMAAKTTFRFLELSARITTIALMAAATGGWIFMIFFMHATLTLTALKWWPKIVKGGVPDRKIWEKICARRDVKIGKRTFRLPVLDDMKLLCATMIWPPSCFIANATDKNGRFWWRSKSCPRKSFLSLDRADAIFPLPAVVAVQVFEAMLMMMIVGLYMSTMEHYVDYYTVTVLINFAWLVSVVGWMSAATLWNPFLPEGPPLGVKPTKASGPWWTAMKGPRPDKDGGVHGGGGDDDASRGVEPQHAGMPTNTVSWDVQNKEFVSRGPSGVTASVGGLFSPSRARAGPSCARAGPSRARTPGGVNPRGAQVTCSYAAGTTPSRGDWSTAAAGAKPGHRRGDSGGSGFGSGGGESDASASASARAAPRALDFRARDATADVSFFPETIPELPTPEYAAAVKAQAAAASKAGSSTVSSGAVPAAARASAVSTTSTDISREVHATLDAAVEDATATASPLKGGASPKRRGRGRYSDSPLSDVNR